MSVRIYNLRIELQLLITDEIERGAGVEIMKRGMTPSGDPLLLVKFD